MTIEVRGSAIAWLSLFQGQPFSIPNWLMLGEADITSKVFPGSFCQMLIIIIITTIIKVLKLLKSEISDL